MALGYGRVATNNFSTAKFIVDTNGLDKGATHTTIASALTDASSGDVIAIRPGTYTEDITLKTGVDITGISVGKYTSGQVIIQGKITLGTATESSITNIVLETNSDYLIEDTGSTTGTVYFNSSRFKFDNDAINLNNSNRVVVITNCTVSRAANSVKLANVTNCDALVFRFCIGEGISYTPVASTVAAGNMSIQNCHFGPLGHCTTSGTGYFQTYHSNFSYVGAPTVWTFAGSGVHEIYNCSYDSGSAAPLVINSGATLRLANTHFYTSNATPISGTGQIDYTDISFHNASAGAISTSTVVNGNTLTGAISFDEGSNYLDYYEEGTWTPTVNSSNSDMTGISYSAQLGRYTRTGNVVYVYGTVTYTATGAGSGSIRVNGLPFTVLNTSGYYPVGTTQNENIAWPASSEYTVTTTQLNVTWLSLRGILNNAGSSAVVTDAGCTIRFNMFYEV